GAHGVVELVDRVGNSVLGRFLGDPVDLCVDFGARGRVGLGEVLFIQRGDLVEIGFFCSVVDGAQSLGALEQQMLEIVGEAGSIRGIVAAAGLDGDLGIETRFFVVLGQV